MRSIFFRILLILIFASSCSYASKMPDADALSVVLDTEEQIARASFVRDLSYDILTRQLEGKPVGNYFGNNAAKMSAYLECEGFFHSGLRGIVSHLIEFLVKFECALAENIADWDTVQDTVRKSVIGPIEAIMSLVAAADNHTGKITQESKGKIIEHWELFKAAWKKIMRAHGIFAMDVIQLGKNTIDAAQKLEVLDEAAEKLRSKLNKLQLSRASKKRSKKTDKKKKKRGSGRG